MILLYGCTRLPLSIVNRMGETVVKACLRNKPIVCQLGCFDIVVKSKTIEIGRRLSSVVKNCYRCVSIMGVW